MGGGFVLLASLTFWGRGEDKSGYYPCSQGCNDHKSHIEKCLLWLLRHDIYISAKTHVAG